MKKNAVNKGDYEKLLEKYQPKCANCKALEELFLR